LSPKVAERTAELARPGHVVAGKYRVVRVLGRGGMGLVVEAVHLALNQRVAIKFHQPQQADDHEQVLRFTQEAKAAAQIRSEHVVRVTDVAELETGVPYMVMEYMEGRDLDRAIVSDGPIAIETAVDYALQACEALA
jgi:serine/threonine-protein kinase